MGRRNKHYSKDLHQQAYEKLTSMLSFGESKSLAKRQGRDFEGVYSIETYKTYWKHIKLYIKWININHPECTTLKSSRKYVNEWLGLGVEQKLSPCTIQTKAKALGKLYNIRPDDPNYFHPPKRERKNIKRSRVSVVRDKHFSVTNNDEFIKFCKSTGARRTAIGKLKAEDLWSKEEMLEEKRCAEEIENYVIESKDKNIFNNIIDALNAFPDQDYFVHFISDKGGRSRFAPIIGENKNQVVERMRKTKPGKKVWEHVPSNADIHSYRADYATAVYKMYAKDTKDISYNETIVVNGKKKKRLYICRKDDTGKKLDRAAMLKCSKALGHNRESVVAEHYLRAL